MSAAIPELLTPSQLAELLHVPARHVLRVAKRGEIPSIELPNGDLLFDTSELVQWLQTRRRRAGAAHA